MSEALLADVRELLCDVFGLDLGALPPDASSETLEAWDSLLHLDVVMALEHRYATTFSPDEIVAMRSIDGIVRVLAAKSVA